MCSRKAQSVKRLSFKPNVISLSLSLSLCLHWWWSPPPPFLSIKDYVVKTQKVGLHACHLKWSSDLDISGAPLYKWHIDLPDREFKNLQKLSDEPRKNQILYCCWIVMFDEAVGSGGCLCCVVLCCIESRVDCRNMESKPQMLGLVCVGWW